MTWQDAWKEGRTPWDAGQSAPVLQTLLGDLPAGRAFVPGAGSGYDVLTLAAQDRSVVGLDLADVARQRFEALADGHPHRERAAFVVGDAFAYAPDAPFDLIWDYTFLCALPIDLRGQWLSMVDRLLGPKGQLAILIFPVVPGADPSKGPPFPITPDVVTDLVQPILEPISVVKVEHSHPGREGKEWLGRYRRRDS